MWGITPLWDSSIYQWMGATRFFEDTLNFIHPASTMFNEQLLEEDKNFASSLDAMAVHDLGWIIIFPYEMSFVAWFILRQSRRGMEHFHKTLTTCSLVTILFLSALQAVHPRWSYVPFESNFFASVVFYHLTAISISISSILLRKNPSSKSVEMMDLEQYQEWRARSARWSIPGTSLILASMISALMVVASLQVIMKRHGIQTYVDVESDISQIFMTSLFLALFHLGVHSFLLYRLRYNIMEVQELKYLCLYKFVLNLVLPLFWRPELDSSVHLDKTTTFGVRILLVAIYFVGYRFAGVGDNVARILTGESAN